MATPQEFLDLVSEWYAASETVIVDTSHVEVERDCRERLENYLDRHPELCPA